MNFITETLQQIKQNTLVNESQFCCYLYVLNIICDLISFIISFPQSLLSAITFYITK